MNSAVKLTKVEVVADIIGNLAQANGYNESITVNDFQGRQAIYVDGDIYDALRAYDGKFADKVRESIAHLGVYLEPYTYSIYEVVEL